MVIAITGHKEEPIAKAVPGSQTVTLTALLIDARPAKDCVTTQKPFLLSEPVTPQSEALWVEMSPPVVEGGHPEYSIVDCIVYYRDEHGEEVFPHPHLQPSNCTHLG